MVFERRDREEGRDDRGKRSERKGGYEVEGSKEQKKYRLEGGERNRGRKVRECV
jgi:hypothetical protein